MTVHAPYRFSPINRWVHFPAWADLVTHDVPFSDGHSGEIHLEIRAETPLLVGGPRREAGLNDNHGHPQPGVVEPFRLASGAYAVPGSSWQGLIRSVLEIATFGKLGDKINDQRFGFRSLAARDETAAAIYKKRMTTAVGTAVTQHSRAGWLLHTAAGPVIVPCHYARIPFDQIEALRPLVAISPQNPLRTKSDANERYDWFEAGRGLDVLNIPVFVGPRQPYPHSQPVIQITYSRAFAAPGPTRTPTSGTLVFTGKPQDGVGPRHKKMEFVFHSPDRPSAIAAAATALPVTNDVWRDFCFIHEAQPGRADNPNWGYWKPRFEAGEPVPVFYLQEGGALTTFGTAFMFKTAQPLSTHQLLKNSHPDHFADAADFPALIFGCVAGENGRGLKRRAAFDTAVATLPRDGRLVEGHHPAILLGPKPSYYPTYVRQPRAQGGVLPRYGPQAKSLPYATYTALSDKQFSPASELLEEHKRPELNGVKVWPAVTGGARFPNLPPLPNGAGPSVQVCLKALPIATTFKGVTLRFHNLRTVELGALLWALTLGEEAKLGGYGERIHRIGMAKPYGLGAVSIRVVKVVCAREAAFDAKGAMSVFVDHMEQSYKTSGDPGRWEDSVQVRTLFKAAKRQANANRAEFNYMTLGQGANPPEGTFQGERARERVLEPYVDGGEAPRPAPGGNKPTTGGGGDAPIPPHAGARVRMNITEVEGVIREVLADGRCVIDLGAGGRRPYRPTLFVVIAAAP